MGHVSRCLTLAQALSDAGWTCEFAVSHETAGLSQLTGTPFDVHLLANASCPEQLFAIHSDAPDLLIIDHYGLYADFESKCQQWAGLVLVIDDVPGRRHVANLLLDSALDRDRADYGPYIPGSCRVLHGPQYALIKDEIAARRETALENRSDRESVERLFLSFGGIDTRGLGREAIGALEAIKEPLAIDVAISSMSKRVESMEEFANRSHHDIVVHRDCTNVGELLAAADLALGAAGVSAWERCVLGVPAVIVSAADNQDQNYEALTKSGAALGIGRPDSGFAERLRAAVIGLASNSDERISMSQKAAACCDGFGASRVVAAIEQEMVKETLHGQ